MPSFSAIDPTAQPLFLGRARKECRTLVPMVRLDGAFACRIGQSKPCHVLSCFQLDYSCLTVCRYMPSLSIFWDLAWLTCPFISPSSKCLRLNAYHSLCPCYFERFEFHFASYIPSLLRNANSVKIPSARHNSPLPVAQLGRPNWNWSYS